VAEVNLRLLEQLCETVAVSGHEDAMVSLMLQEFRAQGLEPVADSLGNVSARAVPRRPVGPHVALYAHMDQLGFMVTQVLDAGFLRVERVGGVSRRCGVGTEVVVIAEKGPLPGVMGIKAHHLAAADEEYTIPPVSDWYLDIGAHSHDEAADNRAGCYVLLEAARALASREEGCPVTLVGTVLEEFNLRGAAPAIRAAAPDVVVGLDVTPAFDPPDLAGRGSVALGGGPAIKIMDFHGRGTIDGTMATPAVVTAMEEAARRNGLRHQKEAIVGVLTEGGRISGLLEGVSVGGISVPLRYTHTAVETADIADIEAAVELTTAFVERAAEGLNLTRGT
jgi:putative aminopeptidase FrvX